MARLFILGALLLVACGRGAVAQQEGGDGGWQVARATTYGAPASFASIFDPSRCVRGLPEVAVASERAAAGVRIRAGGLSRLPPRSGTQRKAPDASPTPFAATPRCGPSRSRPHLPCAARGNGSFGILAFGSCGFTNSDGSLPFPRAAYSASADANEDFPGDACRAQGAGL